MKRETTRLRISIAMGFAFFPFVLIAQTSIEFGDDTSRWANDGECDDPRFVGQGVAPFAHDGNLYRDASDCQRLFDQGLIELAAESTPLQTDESTTRAETGRLDIDDSTLASGEYQDVYTFEGTAGNRLIVDLRSPDFDTFLILHTPSGDQIDNDDHEGDQSRSLITYPMDENGTYEVVITSFRPDEIGDYTLFVDVGRVDGPIWSIDELGRLQNGDNTLESGEYVDYFEFEGEPGQRVTVELTSNDFDTYLVLVGPSIFLENDDADGSLDRSHLQFDSTDAGLYTIGVTSFAPREEGDYQINVSAITPSDSNIRENRDITSLRFGQITSGELSQDDALSNDRDNARKYHDIYAFEANANQEVSVDLQSNNFDTYLILETPSGERYQNDDFERIGRSFLELTAPESGRYRVIVTSYNTGGTGAYELLVDTPDLPSDTNVNELVVDSSSGRRIYGVFAGISDYPVGVPDLNFTAEDAVTARDALVESVGMSAMDAVVLADSDATRANVERAVMSFASEADSDDLFVFFFSGHGTQRARPDGNHDAQDPDAIDETIMLYDAAMLDDELRALLSNVSATTLVVLDSCFSGGFAKDLVSRPGVGTILVPGRRHIGCSQKI